MAFFLVSLMIESPYSGFVLDHAQFKTLEEAQRFILETVARQEDVSLETIEAFQGGWINYHLDSCLLEISQRFGIDLCIYRYKISMSIEQTINNQ